MANRETVDFNPAFFDQIMKSAGVTRLTKAAAERTAQVAKSTAPVDTGAYRDGIEVERYDSRYRVAFRVVGTDWKTLLVESKLGVLARALKAVKK